MSYPQQPYPPQQTDPAAQPAYPPQQPYPPQAQPPAPQAPPQSYPQQQWQQPPPQNPYPQQQWQQPPPQQQWQQPPPGMPQVPQQPLARGTLGGFYSQPGGGKGKSINGFLHKQLGQALTGTVRWTITANDLEQQTDMRTRQPKFFPDGRPMMKLILPLLTQPSLEFPDGMAVWHVMGADRDELNRAMEAAGVPLTPVDDDGTTARVPEAGAQVTIRFTHQRPVPGLNPQNVHEVTYRRPGAAGQAPAPVPNPAQQQAPAQNVVTPQQWQQPQAPPQQQPPWTPQMAEQAGQAAVAQMAQQGNPVAQAAYPQPVPSPQPHPVTQAVQQATQAATAARDANPPQSPAPAPPQSPAPAPAQPGAPLAAPAGMDPASAANLARVSGQLIALPDGSVVAPDGTVTQAPH